MSGEKTSFSTRDLFGDQRQVMHIREEVPLAPVVGKASCLVKPSPRLKKALSVSQTASQHSSKPKFKTACLFARARTGARLIQLVGLAPTNPQGELPLQVHDLYGPSSNNSLESLWHTPRSLDERIPVHRHLIPLAQTTTRWKKGFLKD